MHSPICLLVMTFPKKQSATASSFIKCLFAMYIMCTGQRGCWYNSFPARSARIHRPSTRNLAAHAPQAVTKKCADYTTLSSVLSVSVPSGRYSGICMQRFMYIYNLDQTFERHTFTGVFSFPPLAGDPGPKANSF